MKKNALNSKGQALVEFVLIMPVFIFIIMAMCDFGNIIYKKYKLENTLDTAVQLYENNDSSKLDAFMRTEDSSIDIKYVGDDLVTITLSKEVIVNTPVLSNILGKNYKLESSRTIYRVEE